MDHSTMHDAGHNTVVEVIHFQGNALEHRWSANIYNQFVSSKIY